MDREDIVLLAIAIALRERAARQEDGLLRERLTAIANRLDPTITTEEYLQ